MPKHRNIEAMKDAFVRGFGVALASIWRLHHDGQMVEHLMKHNGFELGSFDGIEMMDGDFEALRAALASREEAR